MTRGIEGSTVCGLYMSDFDYDEHWPICMQLNPWVYPIVIFTHMHQSIPWNVSNVYSKTLTRIIILIVFGECQYTWNCHSNIHTHPLTHSQTFLFFSFKKMPFFALVISVAIISGGLAVSADSSNRLKILASTTFSSFSANCWPMQFLHSTNQHPSQHLKRSYTCMCIMHSKCRKLPVLKNTAQNTIKATFSGGIGPLMTKPHAPILALKGY